MQFLGVVVNGIPQLSGTIGGSPTFSGSPVFSGGASFSGGADLTMGSGSQVLLDDGTSSLPGLAFAGDVDLGLMRFAANQLEVRGALGVALSDVGGLFGFNLSLGGMSVALGSLIGFSTGDCFSAQDTILRRDAAGVLSLRSGTTQQGLRVHNTFTDAANLEYALLSGTAGTRIELSAGTAGTGADDINVRLTPAGTGLVETFGEVTIAGSSASLARFRLRGFYTASPADPPTNQCDIIVVDDGVSPVLRVRYNDAGVMKVGDVALV